jgi:diguanylate cyclase (GGDEF)-like protein
MGYIVSLIDITELVDTIAELTDLASVDTLTQTHTRRYFIERSEVEFARAKRHGHPLSFIILDLDFFKKINDRYGHLAGDSMLTEIANICKSKIRSIDILGRFGGEEFMLLLPETDLEGAYFAANRIRKAIEATDFIFENSEMSMTVSIGVTGVNKIKDENFDVFLRHADRALYKAKENGRNRVEREKCC